MNEKYIVVHAGRRDDYQVALALHEAQMLKFLITDFYSPFDSFLGIFLQKNKLFSGLLSKRYKRGLPSYKAIISYKALAYFVLFNLTGKIIFDNLKGVALGKKANALSQKYKIPVLSMNTYATEAFERNPFKPRVLFQFHPHPTFVKQILQDEININPKSKASLLQEYEFSIPKTELKKLSNEIFLATDYICASSLTKKSLVFEGVEKDKIKVIPYGVDTSKYTFEDRHKIKTDKFTVLFIGSLNQRKGITYLLDALNQLKNIRLHIVGRGIFDNELLAGYSFEISVFQDVSHQKLIEIMHQANCFVLPSIIEGFGQVILEAMATGLPVIASENTAAIDIIEHGKDGFIVSIRDSQSIRDIILKLSSDNNYALNIGREAHNTAKKYTWKRFRTEIVKYLNNISE